MWDVYGMAIVDERRRPYHLDGLATYVRLEYPRGTDPAFLFAEATRRGPKGKRRDSRLREALRTVPRMVRALLRRRERGRTTKLPQSAR